MTCAVVGDPARVGAWIRTLRVSPGTAVMSPGSTPAIGRDGGDFAPYQDAGSGRGFGSRGARSIMVEPSASFALAAS